MRRLLDAPDIDRIVSQLAERLAADLVPGSPLALVGVRTRGVPLAHRLAKRLKAATGQEVPVGVLDITLYRDDLGQVNRWPVLRGTAIPFGIDDRRVVLVDDVLHTGRTVHAAIDALCDLGRPAVLRLAVLIDRGLREFPVQPDYVGQVVATAPGDRINVRLQETDGADEVILL